MDRDIERVLIPQSQIARRVHELAERIVADLAGWGETELMIVPILTGAMIFCSDLIRHMPLRMRIGLLAVSSYPGRTVTSQGATTLADQLGDVAGRHILLLDDILDSGTTIAHVRSIMQTRKPAGVRTCVLLRKDRPEARRIDADYVGFDIPDRFVVGYGLDFDNYYRNLPDIVTLKPSVLDTRGKAQAGR